MKRAVMIVMLLSGAALAGGRGGGGGRVGGGGGRVMGGGGGGRVVVHHTPVARVAPVYAGGRQVVRTRYYDQRMRPGIIVENYGRRPGYYWVPGNWQWDGREWIWYPGRYEVDQAYGQVRVYNGGY